MLVFSRVFLIVLVPVIACRTQSAQNEIGTRRAFEVASIRPAAPNENEASNLDLDPSDYFRYAGGPILASGSLINYIIFAYKIQDRSQADLIYSHLPAWTRQSYTLRATTEDKPTKDQLRLMVQSLLAERFQLKLHVEPQQLPGYVLEVDHSPAPGLTPDPDDTLCTKPLEQPSGGPHSAVPPRSCQLIILNDGERRRARMGGYTLDQIAGNLVLASRGALAPRPILNKTGLNGYYEFDIEFLPPKKSTNAPASDSIPEEPGLTFEEALKRQAGLRLVKQTGAFPVYVIDHVEPPTAN